MQLQLGYEPPTRAWCWVCEQFRESPLTCSAGCMEQDYPGGDCG